jgi:hypothetical protein
VWSHAEGQDTIASGSASHTEGIYTLTRGNYSHAEGAYSTASGDYSHAEGRQTVSSGSYSHAEGYLSISSGSYSHAEGFATVALGDYSHTNGQSTIASGSYQTVVGNFNTQGDDTSRFIVGGGIDNSTRKDAFKVTSNNTIMVATRSIAPSYTGVEGEMVPVVNGGNYYIYVYIGGAWRSSSLA